ncbi:MAG: alpha/beta hydrolase [Acidobacteriota bacterium]|jgi:pimeloyl-ACP methyl ester carboxylesterase
MRVRPAITGDGPPVLIQGPAWGPSSDYLRLTLAPLLSGHRVITYDPRNVGDGPRVRITDAQAVEHLVTDLEELRKALRLERFILAGHSHGGLIAMGYAVRHAQRLDGLLLLNTKVREAPRDRETEELLEQLARDPARREAAELFRATAGRPPRDASDAELARHLRKLMPAYFCDLDAMRRFAAAARSSKPPSSAALSRLPERFEAWIEAGLPQVGVATLVVTGRHDVATTPADARAIAALLPRCRVEIFERSGHHPWAEEPQHFAAVVLDFLANPDRRMP